MGDPQVLASDLRVTIGRLIRRLRAERRGLSLAQLIVLGRLDRDGAMGISALAAAEQVRPQSMAATVESLEAAGLVARRADPDDRRGVLLDLTGEGRAVLAADRRRREGWLAEAIATELTARERRVLTEATDLLGRLAERPPRDREP